MPVHGLGVIKPKGGNWLAGSVEDTVGGLKKAYIPDPELLRIARANGVAVNEDAVATNEALARWMDQKLGKYIKNEMGTPEDPIRALAEKGVTHSEVAPLDTYNLNLMGKRREAVGFPAEGMGQSEQAKAWEAAADDIIHNMPAGERLNTTMAATQKNLTENPWLAKVPPETMTYGTYPLGFEGQTQFGHMLDELRNAVNPESGLPASLRWKYSDLDKVTVPQAVQRVHDINEWRAAQKAEANAMRANNAAAALHKDYPDAPYKWVELKLPELKELPEGWRTQGDLVISPEGTYYGQQGVAGSGMRSASSELSSRNLEDALKYEGETMGHCVGGYCPDVMEGRSRIFSLRNKKTGEPHVTIETRPGEGGTYTQDFNHWAGQEGYDLTDPADLSEARAVFAAQISPKTAETIVQIKGKANRAPKEDYLPYVQDFVRSDKWSDVGDLHNTGLIKPTPQVLNQFYGPEDRPFIAQMESKYGKDYWDSKRTGDEYRNWTETGRLLDEEGFAEGGLVEPPLPAVEYSPLEVDYIIGNVTSGQHEPKYAEGGSVETAHIPYDEAKISSLVNALREELHA
jgi:hypothetical protein